MPLKEHYKPSKEHYMPSKEPYMPLKELLCPPPKSPIYTQKEPFMGIE